MRQSHRISADLDQAFNHCAQGQLQINERYHQSKSMMFITNRTNRQLVEQTDH